MLRLISAMTFLILLSGCDKNHRHQAMDRNLERESLPPEHTVALTTETHAVKENLQMLQEGQILYAKNCVACHGYGGQGDGIVTQRGLVAPESFSTPRMQQKKRQDIYDVLTNGYGRMISFRRKLTEEERWKVASFVKAMQLSYRIPARDLDEKDKRMLP